MHVHTTSFDVNNSVQSLPTVDDAIEDVWRASQDADERLGRPLGGWWSLTTWASAQQALHVADSVVGVAAIEYRDGMAVAEGRVALHPTHRQSPNAMQVVTAVVDLARASGASELRLYLPEAATWATQPAQTLGFRHIRTQFVLLRAADAAPLVAAPVANVELRKLRDGEEPQLLAALNHAWADTWNFRPITLTALMRDLDRHRSGMLVAVVPSNHHTIVGTCHAMFDSTQQNPGGGPSAWISNLTIDPQWRSKGLGRALLAAGLRYLHEQGAGTVALGVDGGAVAARSLYHKAGFHPINIVGIWERLLIKQTAM
jgi:mycothiol synthase